MKRRYEHSLVEHFRAHQQMAFLFGPRPVVKTTTAHAVAKTLGKHQ